MKLFGNTTQTSGRAKSAPEKKTYSAASTAKPRAVARAPRAEKPARPPKVKRQGSGKKVAIIVPLVLVAVLAGGVIAAGMYVSVLDTIYPGVSVYSVPLQGLTKDEAALKLKESGYEVQEDSVGASVVLPDGSEITVSCNEAGLAPDSAIAAEAAYKIGRDSGFFGNLVNNIKLRFNETKVTDIEYTRVNEDALREKVTAAVDKYLANYASDGYHVENDKITLIKGASTLSQVKTDDVYNLLLSSLQSAASSKSFVSTQLRPEQTENADDINLVEVYNAVYREPASSKYDPETHAASASETGRSFDLAAAQAAYDAAKIGATITIPLIVTEPEVKQEDLQALLFRDVLSESETKISGTANRISNVVLAGTTINGTILNPGETFSYNNTTGERSSARGYKLASAYSAGESIPAIGGGVCQGSSTIYNAVLHTDLEVVERRAHSMTVGYLPYGQDATVNFGVIDFKFKNNSPYPIRIDIVASETTKLLNVKIVGTKLDDITIKVVSRTLSHTRATTIYQEDASIAPGTQNIKIKAHDGYIMETTKEYYDAAGNLIKSVVVGKSSYKKYDKLVLVAPGEDPTKPAPAPDPGDNPVPTPTPEIELPPSEG
ncbi:MAG: VanW family protein [Oscillospiraceae bacterium]|jgi:vancomycin resistance protein YoaR|nr:VanW family protein [Oscillospiraceae bacterium]